MYVLLNIPQPFEGEYAKDRFEGTLNRFIHDTHTLVGNYEKETAEMMRWSFKGSAKVVKCKDCRYRGAEECPMHFMEYVEYDDDGWLEHDYIEHDYTEDEGFCQKGEKCE